MTRKNVYFALLKSCVCSRIRSIDCQPSIKYKFLKTYNCRRVTAMKCWPDFYLFTPNVPIVLVRPVRAHRLRVVMELLKVYTKSLCQFGCVLSSISALLIRLENSAGVTRIPTRSCIRNRWLRASDRRWRRKTLTPTVFPPVVVSHLLVTVAGPCAGWYGYRLAVCAKSSKRKKSLKTEWHHHSLCYPSRSQHQQKGINRSNNPEDTFTFHN